MFVSALFSDRRGAGRRLAGLAVARWGGVLPDLVLALPRGGVPVAFELAMALERPLGLLFVRKVGMPGNEELALGALASASGRLTPTLILNTTLLTQLPLSPSLLDAAIERARCELARAMERFASASPRVELEGASVLVVDDGLATGATMAAAVVAARERGAKEVRVAVPVAARESASRVEALCDGLLCPELPALFSSVGEHYDEFPQTSDQEVCALLGLANGRAPHAEPM